MTTRFPYTLLLLLLAAPVRAGRISFVYPPEGLSIPAVQRTFIFGNISPSTAALTINGEKVQVHSNGGFIAYLPVSGGDFVFRGALDDGTTAQRSIKVALDDPAPSTGTLRLDFTSNRADIDLLPGDYLRVSAAGTPGKEAVFSAEGLVKDSPMQEVPAGSGRYYGSYRVDRSESLGGVLSARFKAGLFGRSAAARAKGKVSILPAPTLVETSTDAVVLKNAPDGGYMMFLPAGVKLVSNGRYNGYRRVFLAQDLEGWVQDSKVHPVQGPPYPFGYGSETGVIKLKKTDFGSSAAITMYDKLPYSAEAMPWGLRVTLYYANLHSNWVIYDTEDKLVRNVSFRQAGTGKVEIDFETAPGELWGYEVSYPNGSSMQVDLRARPRLSLSWPKPLSGLAVVLDPGHSVYYKCPGDKRLPMKDVPYSAMPAGCGLDGAVGPMETFEVNVNLAIAQKLKSDLEGLGAVVKMTRCGDENVELADRPKLAKDLGGDIFISIHNNAIGDGEDPFGKPRGFSVYHYQRHSLQLASAIHRAFVKDIDLPDEGERFGDYYVARMTWMPAALIENAYMIIPRQEELLNTSAFQEKLAGAVTEGLLDLFGAPERPANKARKGKK
ncbi:MAG: N-acetylmuramoyl-L-alanine amidase [Elusimicrobia bacterium]|nr:N-acetylmuramoyl-L-alanine amidase [Elusimicrobiota bacterium]